MTGSVNPGEGRRGDGSDDFLAHPDPPLRQVVYSFLLHFT